MRIIRKTVLKKSTNFHLFLCVIIFTPLSFFPFFSNMIPNEYHQKKKKTVLKKLRKFINFYAMVFFYSMVNFNIFSPMLRNEKKKSTKICQFLHHATAGLGPGQYPNTLKTTGASHFGLAIFTLKRILRRQKKEL